MRCSWCNKSVFKLILFLIGLCLFVWGITVVNHRPHLAGIFIAQLLMVGAIYYYTNIKAWPHECTNIKARLHECIRILALSFVFLGLFVLPPLIGGILGWVDYVIDFLTWMFSFISGIKSILPDFVIEWLEKPIGWLKRDDLSSPNLYIVFSSLYLFVLTIRFAYRQFKRENEHLKKRSISGYYLLLIGSWIIYTSFILFKVELQQFGKVSMLKNTDGVTASVLHAMSKKILEEKESVNPNEEENDQAILEKRVECQVVQSVRTSTGSTKESGSLTVVRIVGNSFLIISIFLLFGTVVEFFRTFWCRWVLLFVDKTRFDVYVFSELNSNSLALATSIRGGVNREHALLIFQGVASPVFMDSEIRDLRFEALKLGQVIFNPEDITQRGLGRLKKTLVTVFFCKKDVNENFSDAATIMEGDRIALYELCTRVRFHVLSEGASHGRALMSLQKRDSQGYFKSNKFSLFLDGINRNSVYHLFDHHPLYLGLKEHEAPRIAVIGSGDVVDEIVRTVSWLGLFAKDEDGVLLKPQLDIWDRNATQQINKLKTIFKEMPSSFRSLRSKDVDLFVDWDKYMPRLLAKSQYSYIILATPDAEANIRLATFLRITLTRLFIREGVSKFNIPQIAVHVTDPCLRKHLLDFYPHKGHEHRQKPYDHITFIPFGCRTGAYSEEAILSGERDFMLPRAFLYWTFKMALKKFEGRKKTKKTWEDELKKIKVASSSLPLQLKDAIGNYLKSYHLRAPHDRDNKTGQSWTFAATMALKKFEGHKKTKETWRDKWGKIKTASLSLLLQLKDAIGNYLKSCYFRALRKTGQSRIFAATMAKDVEEMLGLQLGKDLANKNYHIFQQRVSFHNFKDVLKFLLDNKGKVLDNNCEVHEMMDFEEFRKIFHLKLNAIPHFRHTRARLLHFKYQLVALGIVSRATTQLTSHHIQILKKCLNGERKEKIKKEMIKLEYARWCAYQRSNGVRQLPKGCKLLRSDGFKELEAAYDVRIVDNPKDICEEWNVVYADVECCVDSLIKTMFSVYIEREKNDERKGEK